MLLFSKQVIEEIKALAYLFTDVHATSLNEGASKHKELFGSLTVYVNVLTLLCAGVNIGPIGQALKNRYNRLSFKSYSLHAFPLTTLVFIDCPVLFSKKKILFCIYTVLILTVKVGDFLIVQRFLGPNLITYHWIT